jgi:hypothetical protein
VHGGIWRVATRVRTLDVPGQPLPRRNRHRPRGIKPNPFGHSIDLFDPDGNNLELVSEA